MGRNDKFTFKKNNFFFHSVYIGTIPSFFTGKNWIFGICPFLILSTALNKILDILKQLIGKRSDGGGHF